MIYIKIDKLKTFLFSISDYPVSGFFFDNFIDHGGLIFIQNSSNFVGDNWFAKFRETWNVISATAGKSEIFESKRE